MITWVLIIFLRTGGYTNPLAVTNIPNFTTKEECIDAGETVLTEKNYYSDYLCVKQIREDKK